MKLNTEKLDKLQKSAEAQKTELAKIEGKLDSLMEDLRELGYNSVEDAQKELELLEQQLEKRTKIFNKKIEEFTKKYADIL